MSIQLGNTAFYRRGLRGVGTCGHALSVGGGLRKAYDGGKRKNASS